MANAEHINQVIASIRGEMEVTKNVGFQMEDYICPNDDNCPIGYDTTGRNCGTVACIAGHAHLIANDGRTWGSGGEVHSSGQHFLELDNEDANNLFYAWGARDENGNLRDMRKIPPDRAIRTLEHLRDTGEVDWNR